MDQKLFVELLKQKNRIVIPEFGAFMRREEGETSMVTFMPFLKKDDGVFRDALMDYFQIGHNDADEIIKTFVADIKNRLEQNGKYQIEGLGTIYFDANGVVSFQYKPSEVKEVKVEDVAVPHKEVENKETFVSEERVERKSQHTYVDPKPSAIVSAQSPMSSMVDDVHKDRPTQSIAPENTPVQPRPLSSVHQPQYGTGAAGRAPIQPQTRRFPAAHQTPAPKVERPEQPKRPKKPVVQNDEGKLSGILRAFKSDTVLIIALIVAILGLALVIYGYTSTSPNSEVQLDFNNEQTIEQPVDNPADEEVTQE